MYVSSLSGMGADSYPVAGDYDPSLLLPSPMLPGSQTVSSVDPTVTRGDINALWDYVAGISDRSAGMEPGNGPTPASSPAPQSFSQWLNAPAGKNIALAGGAAIAFVVLLKVLSK